MIQANIIQGCSHWGIWSYNLNLSKPLAVLGTQNQVRKGWIVGRMQNDLWHFGEVAPLPTFHNISYDAALNDLINVFKNEQPPQFALTQTVFDIWETPTQEGSLSVNALLGSDADPLPTHRTIKIKMGRRPLEEEIRWFTILQQTHPDIRWRVDCNRQWTLSMLYEFWECCIPDRIEYFEEPLSEPTELVHCNPIPIALDESLDDHPDLLNLPHVIAMVIKPTLHKNWKDHLQGHPDIQAIFSSTFEGSLGLWGLGQLALQYAPNSTHGLGTLGWFKEECVQPPLHYLGDQLLLREQPRPDWRTLQLEDGQ